MRMRKTFFMRPRYRSFEAHVRFTESEFSQLNELAFVCCCTNSAVMRFALKRLYDFYICQKLTVGKSSVL